MTKVILIGGAPTTGKSFTANVLSDRLGLPWISTDTIREQMRGIVKEEDYPNLFSFSEATSDMAVDFLTTNTVSEIVESQNRESSDVWKGVEALIKGDYVWSDGFIIEGVAIMPEYVSKLSTKKEIIPIFLTDNDAQRINETVYTRGLWNEASKYPDSVKDKEVKWVLCADRYLRKESSKYDYKTFEVGDREKYIDNIIKYLNIKTL